MPSSSKAKSKSKSKSKRKPKPKPILNPYPYPHLQPQPKPPPSPDPPSPRIPLKDWLLTGGTGLPPTTTNYFRMASERKAVYREEKAYAEARKAATADFNQTWPKPGKRDKSQKPGRRETMRLFGPEGIARADRLGAGRSGRRNGAGKGHAAKGGDIGVSEDDGGSSEDDSSDSEHDDSKDGGNAAGQGSVHRKGRRRTVIHLTVYDR
ncbi:hypothetical protein GGR50DRAFT_134400 [Xylaria sp. CBS 124048]|nr:hypothetical protein GGR50DRAFT_134400 [Xylaria sp. CBS 124048]